jgi:hypothetical protein
MGRLFRVAMEVLVIFFGILLSIGFTHYQTRHPTSFSNWWYAAGFGVWVLFVLLAWASETENAAIQRARQSIKNAIN